MQMTPLPAQPPARSSKSPGCRFSRLHQCRAEELHRARQGKRQQDQSPCLDGFLTRCVLRGGICSDTSM